ncbi:MAG: SpoIIE family protein phosphatase [Thermoanaerobaculia bacterium]|nr:SpoIIE family protein phosphatase [Thermoanaerobaculia bacterium]
MQRPKLAFLTLNAVLLAAAVLAVATGFELVGALGIAAVVSMLLLWGTILLLRRLLWRVGRKLAFSYFLIGVLPIPMVILLVGLSTYVLFGALLGHAFRDTLTDVHRDLENHLEPLLNEVARGEDPELDRYSGLSIAYYRNRQLVRSNFEAAPQTWPPWIQSESVARGHDESVPFLKVEEQAPRLAVLQERAEVQLVALLDADLAKALRDRSGFWVELEASLEEERVQVQLFGEKPVVLRSGGQGDVASREQFFGAPGPWWNLWQQPILFWGERLSRPLSLTTSEEISESFGALLNAKAATVYQRIVFSNGEVDTVAWGALLTIAFLLFDIYAIATVMALYMIVSLSWAVNRLSQATDRVQKGDFSARIPVRRTDQLGQMQRSFNQMTSSLEELVKTAAQKESLEKELAVARELQQNLLPSSLTTTEAVEFASFFEPSAAIGGDYFDLFRLEDHRIVVVVADVSGHGLSAGLRMAMIKAALGMLIDQGLPSEKIFERLNDMVRRERTAKGRPMVTATLGFFCSKTGRLDITNAGHTPTYLVRNGGVEEILLPSPPLGALGNDYATASFHLDPGDRVVWLSDGLIEAVDRDDRSFGYERVVESLATSTGHSATDLRDRLLKDVSDFMQGRSAIDDRTLVVMRYLPASPSA